VWSQPQTLFKLVGERLVFELVAEAPKQICLYEHLRASLFVEGQNLRDGHTDRQAGGDDSTGACSGDIVEVVSQSKIPPLALGLEQILDLLQHLKREHAANATAINGEELLRSIMMDPVLERHGCFLSGCYQAQARTDGSELRRVDWRTASQFRHYYGDRVPLPCHVTHVTTARSTYRKPFSSFLKKCVATLVVRRFTT
jgi:hypothetical protein